MTTVDLGRLPRGQDGQVIMGQTGKSPKWANSSDAALFGGAWTPFQAGVLSGTGTMANAVANMRYKKIGKTVLINIDLSIISNGTAGSYVVTFLPVTNISSIFVLAGREVSVIGKMLQGVIQGGQIAILNYDNTYPGGDGYRLVLSGVYEAV